jgi:hypothetical protein
MKYELRIRQQYDITLNDEDLRTFLIPQPPESYDPQGYDQYNEVLDHLVMIIRYKADAGNLKGAVWFQDLEDAGASFQELLVPMLRLDPNLYSNPEQIRFRYQVEYDEEVTY